MTVGAQGKRNSPRRIRHRRLRADAARRLRRARIFRLRLPLVGEFQVENALVAAGLAIATGGDAGCGVRRARTSRRRQGPARTRRHQPRRADLHRLRAQARRARQGARCAAALCERQARRGVRRRRRPRSRQAAADGRHRRRKSRPRHRHRRQSAQRGRRPPSAPPSLRRRAAPSKSATAARRSARHCRSAVRRRLADRRQGP